MVEERWDSPAGGIMLGTSKTVKDGLAAGFEFLKITVESDGVFYTPYIKGKRADPFKLDTSASTAKKLVFRNPQNDFPKTIVYERTDSALRVSLLGSETDKPVAFELTAGL